MKGLLKFITCGSVDDGKSTLIGHILYDSKLLYADQEKALLLDSKVGSRGGQIDYSLLLDGLMAEREQGITIDVAYRYFTTDNRSFIVADTPGHEEYTRNMAVGASFAQLAVILIDARYGVVTQTKRHCRICEMMGIEHFVFAINKMDLAGYEESRFCEVSKQIEELTKELSLKNTMVIPVSATEGDNVTEVSDHMPWYTGGALLTYLEQVDVTPVQNNQTFLMPVQRVSRPNYTFRGFQGQIESGRIAVGDEITILPGGETAQVKSILVGDQTQDVAQMGSPVTIELNREVDVSRGCVLTDKADLPVSDQIEATLLWMDDEPLRVGTEYLLALGTRQVAAVVGDIHYRIDVNTGEHTAADTVVKNEIAFCSLILSEKIVLEKFADNHTLGELILIDRVTHMTSACGVVEQIGLEKQAYFEDGMKRASGYLFEELYFDREHAFLRRENDRHKSYQAGDLLPTKGNSFSYPDSFDVLALSDQVVVCVRECKFIEMTPMIDYHFAGLPVVDEAGFALKITSQEDVLSFVKTYESANEKERVKIRNEWSDFAVYRRIVEQDKEV